MDNLSVSQIVITAINIFLTTISVCSAVFSARQTKRQTDLMEEQVKIAREPDYALASHLEGISKAIYHVSDKLRKQPANRTDD